MWRLEWRGWLYWHSDQVWPAIPRDGHSLGLEQDIRYGAGIGRTWHLSHSISLKISLRTQCGNCHGQLKYVKRHAEQEEERGEWLHDDGSPNCKIPALNDKAGKASPVAISNDALFVELQKYDCDT